MCQGLHRVLSALMGHHSARSEDMTIGILTSMRRRRRLARSIEQLLEAAGDRHTAWQFPHPDWEAPLLLQVRVVQACQPTLLTIRDALLDQRLPISARSLEQLKRFLANSSSPLFGDNPVLARRSAEQLQRIVTGRPEP
jgi:hypothetical protein